MKKFFKILPKALAYEKLYKHRICTYRNCKEYFYLYNSTKKNILSWNKGDNKICSLFNVLLEKLYREEYQ